MTNSRKIVLRAHKAAGASVNLARRLKISPQAVHSWRRIPAERVVAVERITGIPREELRPDLYRGMNKRNIPGPSGTAREAPGTPMGTARP